MAASIHGHVDIVKMLIEAKQAQVNTQEEVCCPYHQKTHSTIITPSVIVPALVICVSVHRMVLLLFTWQLRKEKLM